MIDDGSVQIEPLFVSGVTVATSSALAVRTSESSHPAVTTVSELRTTTSPVAARMPRLTVFTNPRFCSLRRRRTGRAVVSSTKRCSIACISSTGEPSLSNRSSAAACVRLAWRTTLARQRCTSSTPR